MFKKFILGATLFISAALASAHGYTAGDLNIKHPWARATVSGATVTGVFMTFKGKSADQLIAASTDVADKVEIHEMKMVDGMMKMRVLDKLDIPANQEVKLAPGGLHIMIFGLKKQLKDGDKFPMTLTFAKAGKVDVVVYVQAITENADPHAGH